MDRLAVPRPTRSRAAWIMLALVSLVGCDTDGAHPSEVPSPGTVSPSPPPAPSPVPSPSGSIVYFVADPERIKRGEASDLRWECASDVPYVQIAILTVPTELLGPFPPKGSVRVRPKQDEFYSLRAHSTSNYQIPAQTVRVFVCRFSGAWDPCFSEAFPPGSPSE